MGLTKDYQKFVPAGLCNVVNSANGVIQAVDKVQCAAAACECVNFYNLRTGEIVNQIRRENHQVTVFKFSPDRKVVAIGYDDGEVHIHSKREDQPVAVFAGHKRGVNTLAFSHDGLTLVSGGKDSIIIVWDILNETGLYRLHGHTDSITQMQFTIDDKYLISCSKDTQIRFWNISTQSCFYTISDSISEIYGFALVKDDRLLVVGNAEIELTVYELTWLERANMDGDNVDESDTKENVNVRTKKIKKDPLAGSQLIDEDADQGNTVVRSKRRGTLIRQAKGRALQLAVSPDESLICVLGGDIIMDVFRLYSDDEAKKRLSKKLRKAKRKAEGQESEVTEAEISRDVTLFIARIGEYRGTAKMKWIDFASSVFQTNDSAREYRIYCIQNNNSLHGIVMEVDMKSNELKCESKANLDRRGHRTDVRCLAISEFNNTFVSGSSDCAILWDMHSLLPVNRFQDEGMKELTAVLYVPSGKFMVFAGKDGTIYVFESATCELVNKYTHAHKGPIWSLVGLPDSTGFVSVGSDKRAVFWEYQMSNEIGTRVLRLIQTRETELEDEILCAKISPNGKFIIFGLLNFTARVHYLDSLKFFVSLYGHSLPVMCIDVDPESKLIVTGSSDKGCKIWGLDFGDCHKSLYGHSDAVTAVKFCPIISEEIVEKLFFSAGKDGLIIQWDATKFHKIQILEGHAAEIRDLAITSTGKTLISASHDKSIRVWEESDELVILSEQEEAEVEKDYLAKMIDAEDIVPGEANTDLASKKSVETIKGTELILEAVEIVRTERKLDLTNPQHAPHVLIKAYGSLSLDHFVLDAIHRVRSSHLEKSLLMVPFGYIPDIAKALAKCIEIRYRVELATRVLLFLFKIHHNYIIRSIDLFPLVDKLRFQISAEISQARSQIGFNAAALKLLKLELEERDNVKIFKDISLTGDKGKEKKKKPKSERTALLRTMN